MRRRMAVFMVVGHQQRSEVRAMRVSESARLFDELVAFHNEYKGVE